MRRPYLLALLFVVAAVAATWPIWIGNINPYWVVVGVVLLLLMAAAFWAGVMSSSRTAKLLERFINRLEANLTGFSQMVYGYFRLLQMNQERQMEALERIESSSSVDGQVSDSRLREYLQALKAQNVIASEDMKGLIILLCEAVQADLDKTVQDGRCSVCGSTAQVLQEHPVSVPGGHHEGCSVSRRYSLVQDILAVFFGQPEVVATQASDDSVQG